MSSDSTPLRKHPIHLPGVQSVGRSRYAMRVVQQPNRARMCGFGEKDKRPIDPPPVVKVFLTGSSTDELSELQLSTLDASRLVVHCDLWSSNQSEDRNLVINPASLQGFLATRRGTAESSNPVQDIKPSNSEWRSTASPKGVPPKSANLPYKPLMSVIPLNDPSTTRTLVGSLSCSTQILQDDQGKWGCFAVFHDLSVRTEGRYTLRFTLMDLNEENLGMGMPGLLSVQDEVFSEPFTVYSANKFPGMTESTSMSRSFARQGIKIPIRKENLYVRPKEITSEADIKDTD
ncbi:hypothetical protein BZG36_02732 [Bifiguratus adelaidae]|uniref:Velvet domain-containing protein n=1 Tax=Bifiguratus adelaidae TaxID=1938954 RepID=A0A261XYR4_9FUNG|nr:hypothetical protein BZG36_02732 [Bifiguratus adelaidae]